MVRQSAYQNKSLVRSPWCHLPRRRCWHHEDDVSRCRRRRGVVVNYSRRAKSRFRSPLWQQYVCLIVVVATKFPHQTNGCPLLLRCCCCQFKVIWKPKTLLKYYGCHHYKSRAVLMTWHFFHDQLNWFLYTLQLLHHWFSIYKQNIFFKCAGSWESGGDDEIMASLVSGYYYWLGHL